MNYATPRYSVPHASGATYRSDVIREEFAFLSSQGLSRQQIAHQLGITDASLRDIIRRQQRRQEAGR